MFTRTKSSIAIALAIGALAISSCSTDDGPIACTEEFRTVGVEVTGKTLDDWYTVRVTTDDTFDIGTSFQNVYAVLDDNFQRTLEGKEEVFEFHGVIADSVWIKEPITIKADECHIEYVSGTLKVDL